MFLYMRSAYITRSRNDSLHYFNILGLVILTILSYNSTTVLLHKQPFLYSQN